MITLDFGAYYRGYCSDITRTFAVGEPDPKMKEIYNIVLSSQIKAINEIRPGMMFKPMHYQEITSTHMGLVKNLVIH